MRSGLKVAACPPSAEEEEGIGCFLLFDLHFSEQALHISSSTTAVLVFAAWRGWGDPELLFGAHLGTHNFLTAPWAEGAVLSCLLGLTWGAAGRKKGGPTTF